MSTIIETGGKQYLVKENETIYVEKMEVEPETAVVFDKVLMLKGVLGTPYVKNAKVTGMVLKQGKQRKIIIYKYKPKKKMRLKQGHRQPYTAIKITEII